MPAAELTDTELAENIEFCRAVMDNDSSVDDIWLEYEDGDQITYADLLAEADKRAERTGAAM